MKSSTIELAGALIGGRYRVQHLLGRGGMAEVYRVHDERLGKDVALKRCYARQHSKAARFAVLLEREYHTLAQLAHPCIIEVYDFGVDAAGPYYSMELLEGSALADVDRLPWQTACVALRDVASALAMLHSRGVVHRDVSMRNVHWSAAGHTKLLDFGAMVTMGVAKDIVGTPPFAAPELMQLQALDGRADLFSLGALGYRLLTGRHAYPAKRFSELRDCWRTRPVAPTALVPEVPAELGALVQRLIALDREARPRTAAEVIEQLRAIAHLEHEDDTLISRAYLTTPTLVGREAAVLAVRRQVLSLVRGDGGVLSILGVSGSGRSRMLDACALEGKLLGAAVIRADARDAASGDWGAARVLGNQLVAQLPKQATETARLSRTVLAQVVEDLQPEESTGLTAHAPERSVIVRELRDWMLALSRSQRLLIVVDDAERIDQPSLALLSALADKARRHPLLLVVAVSSDAKDASPTLELIEQLSQPIQLELLTPAHTEALLKSVFGDVPNSPHCAARIHGLSYGNPRAVMELAQHLVDTGQAHYNAGSWTLPDALDERDLPSSLSASLAARLQELSPDARELAEALALADEDDLKTPQYAALTSHRDSTRMFRAVHELVSARILIGDPDHLLFAQRGFLAVLQQSMLAEHSRELHRRLADALRQEGGWSVRRCHHLLAAGLEAEAIEGLMHIDMAAQPPPVRLLQDALAWAERARMPASTLHRLRMGILLSAPYALDYRSFYETAPAVFARLEEESGLAAYRELAHLPEAERLPRAIAQAQQLFTTRAPHERVYPLIEAIRELARLLALVSGMAGPVFDLGLLEALPSLAPLFPLSPTLVVVSQLVDGAKQWISGRLLQSHAIYTQVLARIGEPDRGGFDMVQHERMRLGMEYALGTLDAMFGLEVAETRARLLEKHRGTGMNAWRVRSLLQMSIGNIAEAERHARRAVMLESQQGVKERYTHSTAGMEVVLRLRLRDILGLKASVERLQKLSAVHPGWRPVELLGRGSYARLQGDLDAALPCVVEGLELAQPGRHPFFGSLAAAHLSLLADLGRISESVELARRYLGVGEQQELRTWELRLSASLVYARAGLFDDAVSTIKPALEQAEALGCVGLAIGVLYAGRAQIAIAAHDSATFERYFERCASEYKRANNPALTTQLAELYDAAAAAGLSSSASSGVLSRSLNPVLMSNDDETVHSRMAECIDGADRARCALTLLLQQLPSPIGYLYAPDEGGEAALLGALPDGPTDPGVKTWVVRYATDFLARAAANDNACEPTSHVTQTESETGSQQETESLAVTSTAQDDDADADAHRYVDADCRSLEVVPLTVRDERELCVAAVLVVQSMPGQRAYLRQQLAASIARELLASGDSAGWS